MSVTKILCKGCGGYATPFDGTGFYCPAEKRYIEEDERVILDADDSVTREIEQRLTPDDDAEEAAQEVADAVGIATDKNVDNLK